MNSMEMVLKNICGEKSNKRLKFVFNICKHGISFVFFKPYMIYKGNIKYSQLSF